MAPPGSFARGWRPSTQIWRGGGYLWAVQDKGLLGSDPGTGGILVGWGVGWGGGVGGCLGWGGGRWGVGVCWEVVKWGCVSDTGVWSEATLRDGNFKMVWRMGYCPSCRCMQGVGGVVAPERRRGERSAKRTLVHSPEEKETALWKSKSAGGVVAGRCSEGERVVAGLRRGRRCPDRGKKKGVFPNSEGREKRELENQLAGKRRAIIIPKQKRKKTDSVPSSYSDTKGPSVVVIGGGGPGRQPCRGVEVFFPCQEKGRGNLSLRRTLGLRRGKGRGFLFVEVIRKRGSVFLDRGYLGEHPNKWGA